MKKIVSLVLALVLVLAIAAPAMAITGLINPALTPASTYAPYYDIDLVLVESTASGLGVLSLQAVAANKAYIKDGLVHFAAFFKTPDLSKVTANSVDFDDPAVVISSDIVNFYSTTFKGYAITSTGGISEVPSIVASQFVSGSDKAMIAPIPKPLNANPAADETTSYVIVGSGVVATAANGTIQLEVLGDKDSPKFLALTTASVDAAIAAFASPGLSIYTGKGAADIKYTIIATKTSDDIVYSVTKPDGSDAGTNPDGSVLFYASYLQTTAPSSSKNLSKITVTDDAGKEYLVVDQGSILAGGGGSSLKFYDAGAEVTSATKIAELTAIYSGVMTEFGFNYSAAGVLHPVHFARKLTTFYALDSVAITLYTSAITVPDASTDVPQTGDAATSIGFVMIALAIVAAAGVAYKKVRA